MRTHPFLRAYMAGIVAPTLFLIVIMTIYASLTFYLEVPIQFIFEMPARPLERLMVFPMAIVPNLWGLWNMLHLAMRSRALPIGLHGALLVFLIVPGGVALAHVLLYHLQWRFVLPAIPLGMSIYYLLWKYAVGFLNQELGIA
jgi:hypothetical protein